MLKIFGCFGLAASDADIRFPHFLPQASAVFGYAAKLRSKGVQIANSL
jgi:hypothetical protein